MDDFKRPIAAIVLLLAFLFVAPKQGWGQSALDDIEALFNQESNRIIEEPAPQSSAPMPDQQRPAPVEEIKSLSGLSRLEPFNDIAVIQKKYLPKTQRVELSGAFLSSINNPFFLNIGGAARLGYNFSEKYAIEVSYIHFGTAATGITKSLKDNLAVETTNFVTSKFFYGADFKWSPIYGKYSFRDKSIIPFDMYFSGGLGVTQTNQETSPITYHLGLGQQLAMTRNIALRWDFSWNIYSSETIQSKAKGIKEESVKDDVLFSIGASFFFPGVKVR